MLKKLFLTGLLVLIMSISAFALDYEYKALWDATDNSSTWGVFTTSIDTSEALEMFNFHTAVIDWKVTAGATPLLEIYFQESNDNSNWITTDSTITITSTAYGYHSISRVGLAYLRAIVKGFVGNTNSWVTINYFLQE